MKNPVKVQFILACGEDTYVPVSEICVMEHDLLCHIFNSSGYADLCYLLIKDPDDDDLKNLRNASLNAVK